MKQSLLAQLNTARANNRRTALVTEIETGAQALLVDGEVTAGTLTLGEELREAAEDCLRRDKGRMVDAGTDRYFVQIFNPPLRLIVVGAVHIAQALVPMAEQAGYETTIIDPRGAWATDERFPNMNLKRDWPDDALAALAPDRRTAVVALTHDPKLDDPALLHAVRSEAFYIGALGSKKTHAARKDRLRDAGVKDAAFNRIHGPIGLDIGAVSPAEIAIAILAQITLTLRGAKGQ